MSPAAAAEKTAPVIALVGTPNSGKTTLFNALTGLRQKVANYPGVTVEKKEGLLGVGEGSSLLLDLPGLYSLTAQTPEEIVTSDILRGEGHYARRPDALVVVLDGSALERSLALLSSVMALGIPIAAVLTMFDEIKARGGRLDPAALSRNLGVTVLPVVGHKGIGLVEVRAALEAWERWPRPCVDSSLDGAGSRYAWARRALADCHAPGGEDAFTARVDRWVLHPAAGPVIFLAVMAFFFQAIFTWAQPAMEGLDALVAGLGARLGGAMPEGLLRGLLVEGVVAGVGSVVVFLPQIMILFFLLFLLEDIGYMARAAFLMDRVMGWAGLQGRSFVALLSSYACAVPGIMATRGIPSPQDRLTTILVAPFMTCSARLPVYAVLIGAFVPDRAVLGPLRSQGLALLGLYALGSVSAFAAAWFLRAQVIRGDITPFYIELPPYRFPTFRSVLVNMLDRAKIFLKRAGTLILGVSVFLWFLLAFPRLPAERAASLPEAERSSAQLQHSLAGRLGKALEPVFRPLGFDWRVTVALLGSLAAREVAVSTLAQIYAVEGGESDAPLRRKLAEGKDPASGLPLLSRAAGLSLLAFFVYALQCTSTLVIMRRETNGWRWPAFAFGYMFAAAWLAAWATRHACLALGL